VSSLDAFNVPFIRGETLQLSSLGGVNREQRERRRSDDRRGDGGEFEMVLVSRPRDARRRARVRRCDFYRFGFRRVRVEIFSETHLVKRILERILRYYLGFS